MDTWPDIPHLNLGSLVETGSPRPAVVLLDGTTRVEVGYPELWRRIGSTITWLDRELPAGATVAILGRNSIDWIVLCWAVMASGRLAVPVSHRFPPATLSGVVADSGAVLVVSEDPLDLDGNLPTVRLLAEVVAEAAELIPSAVAEVDPESPALMLYTSGSTDGPKGVVLSHRSHVWVQQVLRPRADPANTRILVAAPLYHMNALSNVQATLFRGATVVLLPSFAAEDFVAAIVDEEVTAVTGVPPMMAIALPWARNHGHRQFPGVREVFVGSAPAGPALLEEIGHAFPRARIALSYGTSESGPIAFGADPDGHPTPTGSVGRPSDEVQLRLVAPDGRVVGSGGVLEIRCPGLMSGYHGRPELTASAFTDDGYYHTKDVFDVDADGFFHFRSRADEMFVVGGENVHPQAVAEVLERHPAVLQAVVIGLPDEVKGTKPWALVTLVPGAEVGADELRGHALTRLEPNQAPRAVVVVDELPLSGTNKIDSRAAERIIRDRLAQVAGEKKAQ